MTTIEVGMTCRLGKSKTAVQWEVIGYAEAPNRVSLSKLGGDGYVNKTVNGEALLDLRPRLLEVALADVLEWQGKVRLAAQNLSDRSRFFSAAEECEAAGRKLAVYTEAFRKSVAGYQAGIIEHYPHVAPKEGK